jgi:hypothetical protein
MPNTVRTDIGSKIIAAKIDRNQRRRSAALQGAGKLASSTAI